MGKATMEIVSKEKQLEQRNEERRRMIDLLTKRIDDKNKALETKKYVIEGGIEIANLIIAFLSKDAQWKFSEALGIIEAVKQFEESKKNAAKSKGIYVPALALEAVYYFLTKVENRGINSAENYIKILKPVSDALGRSKNDREEIDQLVRDRGTLESALDNGVDIENEDAILKEIQTELAKEI